MKVIAVDLLPVVLPFRFSFGHALSSRKCSVNVLVRVTLDDGTQGYGESVPRNYVTGEDAAGAIASIESKFAPAVLEHDLPDWPELEQFLVALFDRFELQSRRLGAAWCALEMAILDAVARRRKTSLSQLLGARRTTPIRYGAVVPFCKDAVLAAILSFYRLYGFRTVKLKVGTDLERDAERIKLARRMLGPQTVLRVDANCAWSPDVAIEAASLFAKHGIVSYEQPVAGGDFDGMERVARSISAEIVADESLCTLADARRLIERKAAGGFNIRLSKVGGILAARRMAALARAAGVRCHLGAQVGESGILSAAGRVFACLEADLDNYEGSMNLFLLEKDLVRENVTIGWGGYACLLQGPGLGVTVLPERLQLAGGAIETPVLPEKLSSEV
jgi:muconate cycloisomerase